MYKLKEKLDIDHQIDFAEKVGITPEYLSYIQNGRACSKITAYAITKIFNSDKEILELFDRIIKE